MEGAIVVNLNDRRQQIDGFGNSITESSVFVLACLTPEQRHAVLEEMYGADGANFSASRTVVGASDFALKGHYSYDDVDGDEALEYFSMAVHQDGFSQAEYPQIKDETFDMWQCLHEIAAIKDGSEWRLVASPWTAPAWMKDNKQFVVAAVLRCICAVLREVPQGVRGVGYSFLGHHAGERTDGK